MKCLLVDDVEDNLRVLVTLLADQGVELLCARSGRAALELLLEHEVALALVDVQMPEMDGFELAELMRGSVRTRDVPIIFVTAGSRDQSRVFKGYELGAVDFLFKPIEPHVLLGKTSVFFQLYRQREQLARQLHEKTEALRTTEMFMAILSHDLRNPLNAVLASGQLLARQADPQAVQKIASRIISSGTRMTGIIEQMLDVARARLGGGIKIVPETAHLGDLVRRVASEQQAQLPELKLQLAESGDLVGTWDPGRLAQAVSNLLGNAVKHGNRAEAIQIELDGLESGSVRLVVSNAGGIPESSRRRLFEPFQGRETGGKPESGLGLGLYIVQQIVAAHGGSVEACCDEPERTAFVVQLPRSVLTAS